MKLAIMQPYFFPYCGYFQLMAAVDAFVVYDNIKYTKKGWINRNRIQVRGAESLISLPLKKTRTFWISGSGSSQPHLTAISCAIRLSGRIATPPHFLR